MSFLAAVVALSWLAIGVLGLTLAGVIRQLRDVSDALREGNRPLVSHGPRHFPTLKPAAGVGRAIVLVVDDVCLSCRLVFPEFAAQASRHVGEFRVLTYTEAAREWLVGQGVPVDVDPETFRELNVPWRPALVLIDADGAAIDVRPVGSVASLEKTVEEFCQRERERAR